uniref:Uncharacterized protein n=1 Tax=Timema cristinae TaxID=61476 RepID=A0A7R9D3T4_TIMCR|nr:unnamed protein product [Timema cristinae]
MQAYNCQLKKPCFVSRGDTLSKHSAKWGVKDWSVCDSKTGFICTFCVYTGKNIYDTNYQPALMVMSLNYNRTECAKRGLKSDPLPEALLSEGDFIQQFEEKSRRPDCRVTVQKQGGRN